MEKISLVNTVIKKVKHTVCAFGYKIRLFFYLLKDIDIEDFKDNF